MNQDMLIWVKAVQTNLAGERDTIELCTPGKLYFRKSAYYLIYQETALTGMEGTTTTLKIEGERVVLSRRGAAEQTQSFQTGVQDDGLYVTPHGVLNIGVLPTRVEAELDSSGGVIQMEYELKIGQEKISDNWLEITVSHLNGKTRSLQPEPEQYRTRQPEYFRPNLLQ